MATLTEQNFNSDIRVTKNSTSLPTITDYKYRIGEMWTRIVSGSESVSFMFDNTEDAAVWGTVNLDARVGDVTGLTEQSYNTDIRVTIRKLTAPTASDYKYRIGDIWLEITNDRVYVMVDNTEDSAVWLQFNSDSVVGTAPTTEQNYHSDIKQTVRKTSAPTVTDYKYTIGTIWLDTTGSSEDVWIMVDNTEDAAVWYQLAVDTVVE